MADITPLLPFSIAELMRRLGRKSYSGLHRIVSGKKKCTALVAIRIEEVTGGAVTRSDMRPDLWPAHVPPSEDAA